MNASRDDPPEQRVRRGAYSPANRTAVVFCGTGAHGAYHAGVLRALQEAGVRIDLLAGHGIGAAAAAIAAIDGGPRLWGAEGMWRAPAARRFYRWKAPVRAAGWFALALLAVLLAPVLLLAAGLILLPAGFLLEMVGAAAGGTLTSAYSAWLLASFGRDGLPAVLPRIALLVLAAGALTVAGLAAAAYRTTARRRAGGAWGWRLLGAPIDADVMRQRVTETIWELVRGAASLPRPSSTALARRYCEVLAENLGQPGFRELLVVATDLDARGDIVAALLTEPFRREFVAPRPGRERRAEVLDLAGVARDHAIDVLAGALTPPFICDPRHATFAPDSFWRGETHRLCDRPGSAVRVLDEVAAAGATQVIVVTAVAPVAAPHRLRAPRLDPRSRMGELLAAAETAAVTDALERARLRFASVFTIRPAHNALGPFDLQGAYDDASDRRQPLAELMERGYEDAYRQFIDPIVGGSGEQLARSAHAAGTGG